MKTIAKVHPLLQLIPRKKFNELCKKWEMDKGVRGFTTWEQTCALILTHILKLESYREVQGTLGIARSTFSDANSKRPYGFFTELCEMILTEIKIQTPNRHVRKAIKNILALDSTECRVHGSLFDAAPDWSRERNSLGKKAGLKLHTLWNVKDEWIEDFRITPAKRCDNPIARQFSIQSNATYVFDRGYQRLDFWWKIMESGSDFVTRLKCHQINEKELLQVIDPLQNGVLLDTLWFPAEATLYINPTAPKGMFLRHIVFRDTESQKIFHFVTSNFDASPEEIAGIYKKRWSIELLYRWLKGHLNIRYFSVKSVNAVRVLLTIAILVRLLVQLHKVVSHIALTAWECLRDLRLQVIRESLQGLGSCPDCRWSHPPNAAFKKLV